LTKARFHGIYANAKEVLMDKQAAEITAMQELRDARAYISRAASVVKEGRAEEDWKAEEAALLGTANAHLNTLDDIRHDAELRPEDIGTCFSELSRLRAIAIGARPVCTVPPPKDEEPLPQPEKPRWQFWRKSVSDPSTS
jgi:hypothetical protein